VQAVAVALAAIAFPIAHIGNIAELAVPVDVALTLAFGSLVVGRADAEPRARAPGPAPIG
jgi:hypothetical protein